MRYVKHAEPPKPPITYGKAVYWKCSAKKLGRSNYGGADRSKSFLVTFCHAPRASEWRPYMYEEDEEESTRYNSLFPSNTSFVDSFSCLSGAGFPLIRCNEENGS